MTHLAGQWANIRPTTKADKIQLISHLSPLQHPRASKYSCTCASGKFKNRQMKHVIILSDPKKVREKNSVKNSRGKKSYQPTPTNLYDQSGRMIIKNNVNGNNLYPKTINNLNVAVEGTSQYNTYGTLTIPSLVC